MRSAEIRRRRVAWLMIAVAAAMIGAGRPARADEPAAEKRDETTWYGWQTLASDGTAIALWAAAIYLNDAKYTSGSFQTYDTLSNAAGWAGLGVYVLGAPVLHARRGNWDKFGGSLTARLGLPVIGMLMGALAGAAICGKEGDGDEIPCPVVGGVLGIGGGMLAAMIVDAAKLAHDGGGPSVQPVIVPTNGGVSFTLAGRF